MLKYYEVPPAWYSLVEAEEHSILFETSCPDPLNEQSLLFLRPLEVLTAHHAAEMPSLFASIDRFLVQGCYAAGYVAYECNFQDTPFEREGEENEPLAYFGIYGSPVILNHRTGDVIAGANLNRLDADIPAGDYEVKNLRLAISAGEYANAVRRIQDAIVEGDTYQVNFTTACKFEFTGSPIALYRDLKRRQPVPYGGILHAPQRMILSLSPELFFRRDALRIESEPMKGTMKRGRAAGEDALCEEKLRRSQKERAENLMIVDLLRNDIGRIAEYGSVRVRDLFSIKKYPTLFQMTSTIEGRLRNSVSHYEVFQSLFPSGSVTGAPKISSMRLIQRLESRRRGVYTGAIGYFAPDNKSVFNVAIRTISIEGSKGVMGVGSGIVADSVADDEYEECLLKSLFLSDPCPSYEIIETLLWDNGYPFLPLHVNRMTQSAEYFQFPCSPTELASLLLEREKAFRAGEKYRVRVLLDRRGEISLRHEVLEEQPLASARVALCETRTESRNRFLYHKTSNRPLYKAALREARAAGFVDLVFRNELDQITEGTTHNIIIRQQGRFFTPPVSCGLLNGVYRQHLLRTRSDFEEKTLSIGDLLSADAIYLCNAVRRMREVFLASQRVAVPVVPDS